MYSFVFKSKWIFPTSKQRQQRLFSLCCDEMFRPISHTRKQNVVCVVRINRGKELCRSWERPLLRASTCLISSPHSHISIFQPSIFLIWSFYKVGWFSFFFFISPNPPASPQRSKKGCANKLPSLPRSQSNPSGLEEKLGRQGGGKTCTWPCPSGIKEWIPVSTLKESQYCLGSGFPLCP